MSGKRKGPLLGVSLALGATAGFAAIVGVIAGGNQGGDDPFVASQPIARDVSSGQAAGGSPAGSAAQFGDASEHSGERIIVIDPGVRDETTRGS